MTAPLFIALPGNALMAEKLATLCGGELGAIETRDFPDGETYLRLRSDVVGRSIVLVCTLARPNEKILPLIFAAETARELGARKVGLVAPYLCYMRQDRRFQTGEAVTSRHFAALISRACDWLVTIDPHLHRYKALSEIYAIPAGALHAGAAIADWIKNNIENPFLIGPDEESEQWVSEVARDCAANFAVLHKQRLGDRDVRIAPDRLDRLGVAKPVLIDDIISSGETILEAVGVVKSYTRRSPIAIGVHGLFADGSDKAIEKEGATLVTSDTVPHASNRIDIAGLLAPAIMNFAG
jgi:ribose-phosphate pyrophosphokinase